jgi:hypothetical protein
MSIKKIIVNKVLSNDELEELTGTQLPNGYFKMVLNEDCDVYTEEGEILLKLRKNVFSKDLTEDAYNNIINHARLNTTTRGIVSGRRDKQKGKLSVRTNKPIRSNIVGYFDTIPIGYKGKLKKMNMKLPISRHCAFNKNHPDKWENFQPFIKAIDNQYKELFPDQHQLQLIEADKTKYRIKDTCFTTITTNLNVQTGCHADRGDFKNGFGNLVVIEKGHYYGGYIGFPEYGVGVDLRSGDFLAMDVHKLHGNEPIIGEGDYQRLSFVSYLRDDLIKKTQNIDLLPIDYFENPECYQDGNYFKK